MPAHGRRSGREESPHGLYPRYRCDRATVEKRMPFFKYRWNLWALLLCGVLITSHPVEARAGDAETVQAVIRDATRLFEGLEYEQAIEKLRRAKRGFRNKQDTAPLWLYEGLLLAELNRMEEAEVALLKAFTLRLDLKLPVDVSPKTEAFIEKSRRDAAEQLRKTSSTRVPAPQPVPPDPRIDPEKTLKHSWVTDTRAPRALSRLVVPAIAGGVLFATGGVSWGLARQEQSRLRRNDQSLTTPDDVRRAASRGRAFQTVGLSLMGAGLVTLGTAAGLHVFRAPEAPSMTLEVGPQGVSAGISGRWP